MRSLFATPIVLTRSFDVDGVPTDASAGVSVSVVNAAGTTIATGAATRTSAGVYTYTVASLPAPDLLTVTWVGSWGASPTTVVDQVEAVGERLATVAEVRSLDGLADTTTFPSTLVAQAIEWAEDQVADYCGSRYVRRLAVDSIRLGRREPSRDQVALSHPLPSSIRWVKVDGVTVASADFDLETDGSAVLYGTFLRDTTTEVAYEHGPVSAPESLRWAARTLARHYLLALESRLPDRALSIQSDFGQIMLAQAGGPGRPTSLPEVNAVLNRYRVRGY